MLYKDLNTLIRDGNFKNYTQVSEFLLNEFHRAETTEQQMDVLNFARANNFDFINILKNNEVVEFENNKQPSMSKEELANNINQVLEQEDIAPKIDDERVKKVLE